LNKIKRFLSSINAKIVLFDDVPFEKTSILQIICFFDGTATVKGSGYELS